MNSNESYDRTKASLEFTHDEKAYRILMSNTVRPTPAEMKSERRKICSIWWRMLIWMIDRGTADWHCETIFGDDE